MTASTATPSAATSRDAEVALLARCCAAARGDVAAARNQREANAFRVAAMLLIYTRFPNEYEQLMQAADSYFAAHPCDLLEASEVLRRGWIPTLPRLRDMLERNMQVNYPTLKDRD